MLQLLGGRWERNPAAEQRICGRRPAQIANMYQFAILIKLRPLSFKFIIRIQIFFKELQLKG